MAPGPMAIEHADMQRLVPQNSTHSFFLDENEQVIVNMLENEVSITRPIDHRKYSTMSFKAREMNSNTLLDITIEKGQYKNTMDPPLEFKSFTSQDIRQKYSFKARLAVGLVFALLLGMCILLLVTLFRDPSRERPVPIGSQDAFDATLGTPFDNSTMTASYGNVTQS